MPHGMQAPALFLDEVRFRSPKQCIYEYYDPDEIRRIVEHQLSYLVQMKSLA
jgi:hypothetical protein